MICSVPLCGRAARAAELCNRHYENLRRHGHATPVREWSVLLQILHVGATRTPTGCWEWDGARNDQGYGLLNHKRVHRLMYSELVGDPGPVLRHRCDNPPCINPAHLEPGTQADNVRDMAERGRHWMHGKTHCPNGHEYTPENTGPSKEKCRQCGRDRKRKSAAKKKEAARDT